jgi:hypothetical protein
MPDLGRSHIDADQGDAQRQFIILRPVSVRPSTMKRTRGIRSKGAGAQFVIAVFDDWEALQAVLDEMGAPELHRLGAVLHAREDNPPPALNSGLLREMIDLPFEPSAPGMRCTRGEFAEELAARLAGGARSLARGTPELAQCRSGLAIAKPYRKRTFGLVAPARNFRRVCRRLWPPRASTPSHDRALQHQFQGVTRRPQLQAAGHIMG